MSSNQNFCSNCGQKLDSDISECPKCHSPLHEHSKHVQPKPSVVQQLPYKSPGTTALIAFLGGIVGLAGIGHMYVGKARKGITILIGGILLFIISIYLLSSLFTPTNLATQSEGGIYLLAYLSYGVVPASFVYLIYFTWQILDARKFAKKFNESVRATGNEPW